MPPQNQPNLINPLDGHHQGDMACSYAFLIILVVLMFISGGFATWYFLNPPPEPEPENVAISQPDQFADWKTYRNEEYGFEFRYPNIFEISEHYLKANNTLGQDDLILYTTIEDYQFPTIEITFVDQNNENLYNTELSRLFNLEMSSEYQTKQIMIAESISPDIVYVYPEPSTPEPANTLIGYESHQIYLAVSENKTFIIKIAMLDLIYLNKFLSTFKFIPPTSSGQISTSTPQN